MERPDHKTDVLVGVGGILARVRVGSIRVGSMRLSLSASWPGYWKLKLLSGALNPKPQVNKFLLAQQSGPRRLPYIRL